MPENHIKTLISMAEGLEMAAEAEARAAVGERK